jgi:hypothetical protein
MAKMCYNKVRVTFKTPLNKKTETMYMNSKTLKLYRTKRGRKVSPYKTIVVIEKKCKIIR